MTRFFVIWAIVAAVMLGITVLQPYDDTDNAELGVRSGMVPYIDHLTGCEYLRVGFLGGAVRRVDGYGQHVGCKK